MKTEMQTVSPKMAAKWLETVSREKQRSFRQSLADQYTSAMRLGHWVVTHQGIAFDEEGNLCDGQHRMAAVVQSGVTINILVTTGLPVCQGAGKNSGSLFTFDAIDRGSLRGIGEQLHVRHGIKDANRIAAGARVIAIICTRTNVKMTVANTLSILTRFGNSLCFVNKSMKVSKLHIAGVLGSLAFCHRAMPNELHDFIVRVGEGTGSSSGDPAVTYRNYVLDHVSQGGLFSGTERAGALAAMHAVLKNSLKLIKATNAGIDFFADKQPRIVDEVASMF